MVDITREQLAGYLDDALGEAETAQVELALRQSEPLRLRLRAMMLEQDHGEHSLGAIWRRHRLSCPSREQLGSFLLGVLEAEHQDYVEFHLRTVGCAFCRANLADLEAQHQQAIPESQERRRRFFESSRGLLSSHPNVKK